MLNIDDEIRAQTEAFANDLADLVRRAALESVSSALGGANATLTTPGRPKQVVSAPVTRAPAPAMKPVASRTPVKAAPASKAPVSRKAAAPKRPFGAKRPPAELAKLTEKLGDFIQSHPGLRIEAISKALGAPTKDLNLPVKKLIAAKKIRSEGHKRATEYFAA